jgi:hypothetical protein
MKPPALPTARTCSIEALVALLLVLPGSAWATPPLSLTLFKEATVVPGAYGWGVLGGGFHPGIAAGTEFEIASNKNVSFVESAEFAMYSHDLYENVMWLRTDAIARLRVLPPPPRGVRPSSLPERGAFIFEISPLGVGVMQRFLPGPTWGPGSSGVETAFDWGHPALSLSAIPLGVGWDPVGPFCVTLRYRIFFEIPPPDAYLMADMPHSAIEVVTSYKETSR